MTHSYQVLIMVSGSSSKNGKCCNDKRVTLHIKLYLIRAYSKIHIELQLFFWVPRSSALAQVWSHVVKTRMEKMNRYIHTESHRSFMPCFIYSRPSFLKLFTVSLGTHVGIGLIYSSEGSSTYTFVRPYLYTNGLSHELPMFVPDGWSVSSINSIIFCK